MYTCSKTYSDIPFAHRQYRHVDLCNLIHGHNWSFTFTFGCTELDEKEFVVDFGALGFLKDWLVEQFDHAFVYGIDDEACKQMLVEFPDLFKAIEINAPSTEGVARYVFDQSLPMIHDAFGERVSLISVSVSEDSKNSAEYRP
mgnify:CR=1 FL=1|tara:strand:+ start:3285 stop:3713 length:429 start_codon:yes stop_codon:yes gene_type:complete